jgi:hypothetical protein
MVWREPDGILEAVSFSASVSLVKVENAGSWLCHGER